MIFSERSSPASNLTDLKFSIITAVYNRAHIIGDALNSVYSQTYSNIEHIVIDGASTDGTLELVQSSVNNIKLVSEPDNGIYDALNKGVSLATGEVIGFLHSDDVYHTNNILEEVARAFTDSSIDAVFGDLNYVSQVHPNKIIRKWRTGNYSKFKLALGWMPAHPALFLRKHVYDKFGCFNTKYKISADYDSILRIFGTGEINSVYIPKVFVKMRLGGESNANLLKICLKTKEDYLALKRNRVGGIGALMLKNVSKLGQFF